VVGAGLAGLVLLLDDKGGDFTPLVETKLFVIVVVAGVGLALLLRIDGTRVTRDSSSFVGTGFPFLPEPKRAEPAERARDSSTFTPAVAIELLRALVAAVTNRSNFPVFFVNVSELSLKVLPFPLMSLFEALWMILIAGGASFGIGAVGVVNGSLCSILRDGGASEIVASFELMPASSFIMASYMPENESRIARTSSTVSFNSSRKRWSWRTIG
jgi:hypothetical protein